MVTNTPLPHPRGKHALLCVYVTQQCANCAAREIVIRVCTELQWAVRKVYCPLTWQTEPLLPYRFSKMKTLTFVSILNSLNNMLGHSSAPELSLQDRYTWANGRCSITVSS